MPEEYFDILDEQGNPTGEKRSRFEAHSQGLWHKVVHIYLFRKINDKIEFLVHLRSKTKDLNPNTWDTRFGGHLKSGEGIEDALVTEIKDEIGLTLKPNDFIQGETQKSDKFPNREFVSVFYYNYNDDLEKLRFDDGEVQEVKWMTPEDITKSMGEEPSNWSGETKGFTSICNFLSKKIVEEKTLNALKWIVGILNRNNIPYCIGGGMAVYLYGSGRPVNDIDISVSGQYFPTIAPLVKDYIVIGPKHYKNDKWDCTTLSLNYEGQDIDMTDADTLLMSKKDGTGWIRNKEIYQKYPNVIKDVSGINISLMDPRVLLEYKQELDGEHQEYDRKFLEQYIKSNYYRK